MNEKFKHSLSSEEMGILKSIIGEPLDSMTTTALSVYPQHIEAPHLSLTINLRNYVNVSSEYRQTPNGHVMAMSITRSENPMGISTKKVGPFGSGEIKNGPFEALVFPFSEINFEPGPSKISSIEVYEHVLDPESETHVFDGTLIFTRDNGDKFELSVHDSINPGIEYRKVVRLDNDLFFNRRQRVCLLGKAG